MDNQCPYCGSSMEITTGRENCSNPNCQSNQPVIISRACPLYCEGTQNHRDTVKALVEAYQEYIRFLEGIIGNKFNKFLSELKVDDPEQYQRCVAMGYRIDNALAALEAEAKGEEA